ncbi:MAG: hypothetical protein DIZ79_13390 [endosymbiont of Lamellibrachia luymesi]|uniref:Uncharacterized protein n=1 Tax=endosymbiont of Lamellibrachia luymesi TaxID=2200907 RepID=A0A370DUH3_9GAMM|nr:MAG: hypothetical protein DIZ79_13390 [endosymbiont of Lamellibrachia luymesi]
MAESVIDHLPDLAPLQFDSREPDMKITVPVASISTASLLITTLAITGCSGSQEEVRVTFCKDLSSSLLYSQEDVMERGRAQIQTT